MAVSTSSDASSYSSSSPSPRRRHPRGKREKVRDALQIRKGKNSNSKRRRRNREKRYVSSCSSSDSDSSRSDSSPSIKHEGSNHSKRHKIDKLKKGKQMDGCKRHYHKHQLPKVKEKQQDERGSSPVQLSKFLGRRREEDGLRRSAVSGRTILLKVDKSKEDKEAESKRNELLRFLNASFD